MVIIYTFCNINTIQICLLSVLIDEVPSMSKHFDFEYINESSSQWNTLPYLYILSQDRSEGCLRCNKALCANLYNRKYSHYLQILDGTFLDQNSLHHFQHLPLSELQRKLINVKENCCKAVKGKNKFILTCLISILKLHFHQQPNDLTHQSFLILS